MRTDLFDFELPDELIALHPVTPRDAARLLVAAPDGLHDRSVRDLPHLLRAGDVLVCNNTRVIPAALEGVRERGEARARIAVNLHRRVASNRWRAFARPARKLDPGERVRFGSGNTSCLMGALDATVVAKSDGGEVELAFDLDGAALDAAVAGIGAMPLPPYIAARRSAGLADLVDYQTVYAQREGAVAAPTAGLHFTDRLLADIQAAGIDREELTLHVGAGTFLPVKADDIESHVMHAEWGEITPEVADALNRARAAGGRIVAVGTTVVRLLESAADTSGEIRPFSDETDIFIAPGHEFRAVDAIMTNFHLPRSTLIMLVAAFAGLDRIREAYTHAVAAGYRFYSYGDASLLWPAGIK